MRTRHRGTLASFALCAQSRRPNRRKVISILNAYACPRAICYSARFSTISSGTDLEDEWQSRDEKLAGENDEPKIAKEKKEKWNPPKSPYQLLQETFHTDPWKLLITCIFLNRTQKSQVSGIIHSFFEKYPTPFDVINAPTEDLVELVRPLGLYNRRATSVREFSEKWVEILSPDLAKRPHDPSIRTTISSRLQELPHIGPYAQDAWKIFIQGRWKETEPSDEKLILYRNWLFKVFDQPGTSKASILLPGLYVVGTPIGNLNDLTLRGWHILRQSDYILAEDTRQTKKLLDRYLEKKDREKKRPKLVSYHKYSTPEKLQTIMELLEKNQSIVSLVTDAGTPLISDPGAELIKEVHQRKLAIFSIPGPSAVTAALSVSGFPADRFVFEGFLPRTSEKRKKQLMKLQEERRTAVFFEAPHRIVKTLEDCVAVWGSEHEGAIVRELTKVHEEVVRGSLSNLVKHAKEKAKGEFTVVVGPVE